AVGLLVLMIWYLSRRKRVTLPFARIVGGNHDLEPLAALVFCFGAAGLTGLLQLSPVLGAFLAGIVIGNSTARSTMIPATRPIQSILLMVFFLSIGLLIDLVFIWDNIGTVILLLFIIAVVKTVLNIGILRVLREPWPHAFIAGVMLAQIGEFSLVLGQTATSSGLISREIHQLIIASVAFSLLLSPLWLSTARRLLRILLLSVTSFSGTIDVFRTRRVAAVLRYTHQLSRGAGRLLRQYQEVEPSDPDPAPREAAGKAAERRPVHQSWRRRIRRQWLAVWASLAELLGKRRAPFPTPETRLLTDQRPPETKNPRTAPSENAGQNTDLSKPGPGEDGGSAKPDG
ncbi:MAG: cation:proton antiporter, partial [Pseudomonadota bacterium]